MFNLFVSEKTRVKKALDNFKFPEVHVNRVAVAVVAAIKGQINKTI